MNRSEMEKGGLPRWHVIGFILLIAVTTLVCRQIAFGKMYSYKDKKGTVHFVDSAAEIPWEFRQQAKSVETERDISPEEQSFVSQLESAADDGSIGSVRSKLKSMTKKFQQMASDSNYGGAVSYIRNVMRPFIEKNVSVKGAARGAASGNPRGLSRKNLLKDLDGVQKKMLDKQTELDRIMRSDDSTNKR